MCSPQLNRSIQNASDSHPKCIGLDSAVSCDSAVSRAFSRFDKSRSTVSPAYIFTRNKECYNSPNTVLDTAQTGGTRRGHERDRQPIWLSGKSFRNYLCMFCNLAIMPDYNQNTRIDNRTRGFTSGTRFHQSDAERTLRTLSDTPPSHEVGVSVKRCEV